MNDNIFKPRDTCYNSSVKKEQPMTKKQKLSPVDYALQQLEYNVNEHQQHQGTTRMDNAMKWAQVYQALVLADNRKYQSDTVG